MIGAFRSLKAILVVAVTATAASAALAQPVADAVRGTAADPGAPVEPMVYHSPFARYRPLSEAAVAPWKSVNDEVARIGGWKAYAREAQEGAASATTGPGRSPSSAAPPRPAAAGARK